MKKIVVFCLAAILVSAGAGSNAFAQRDSGAKARGEFGRGFWNSRYSRSYYMPSYGSTVVQSGEAYRSFSYEPVAFDVGDKVMVAADSVKMMKGSEIVGAVPKGTKFTVIKVVNGWLGAAIELEGKTLNGWIWHGTAAKDSVATAPQPPAVQEYRSFSYEPASPVYQTRQPRKKPWQYPKGDRRRYSY